MKKIGIITTIIIIVLGLFCTVDLFTRLNIQNKIIGTFYSEPDFVKINDFEYDVKSLLFYNSDNENQYFATINSKPVSNFDKTKKYNVTINGIEAKRVEENNFIHANFTNEFISTLNETIMIDTLNIKINFYTEGTKIVFTTDGGEDAVKLWSSFIAKNGFKLKIVETDYIPQMEADNLPSYTLNLHFNNEIIETINFNALKNFEMPKVVNNKNIKYWIDIDNNIYTKETLPLKNIDLYAVVDSNSYQYSYDKNNVGNIKGYPQDPSCTYISNKIYLTNESDIEFFNNLVNPNVEFDIEIKIDFYGHNFTIGKDCLVYRGGYSYNDEWFTDFLNFHKILLENLETDISIYYDNEENSVQFEFLMLFYNSGNTLEMQDMYNAFILNTSNGEMNCKISFDITLI